MINTTFEFYDVYPNPAIQFSNKNWRENLKNLALPGNSLLLIHQSIYSLHPNFVSVGGRRLKMSNKPTNIDLTKWRGVTFTNNSLKMDVFLINGASMSMASRPLGPIGKPAIFQNHPKAGKQQPQKLKPIQSKRNFSKSRNAGVPSRKRPS